MQVFKRGSWLGALLVIMLAAPVMAQTGTVMGRLTAADRNQPLVSALVEAVDANGRSVASAISNQEGLYRLTGLAPGSYAITVSSAGYGTQTVQTVQVAAGQTVTVDASLEPRAFELNPVVISASKRQEKALDAPARVEVVNATEIEARPAVSPVDHLRSEGAVDIISAGVQSSFVVVRGFNNIFSGSLHMLTDNRIAGIPSLRVNLLHFIPQSDDDFERMEVVLGPGAALYGPNTANGVLHIITKSPLDDPITQFSVAGGEQSVFQFTGRTAHRLSDRFGFKLSGQYFRGDEWSFRDSVEDAARAQATTSFQTWAALQPRAPDGQPLSLTELQSRASRLAQRDFDIERWAIDGRADWRASGDLGLAFSGGVTSASKGIELTGIGAAQVNDWLYSYYQARGNYKRWFGQVYLNTSDAGETFLLRTGAPIVDKSKVFVTQLQHTANLGNRFEFVYGGDFIRTMPETERTINGSREDDDNYDQYGAYLQARAQLTPQFDLVAAVREDWHSELNDPVFSPRAALVFKPTPTQNFRLTYNRAFSTPSSLNLFLDIDGGPAGALGPFGFRVRAQGPGKDGIRLVDASGAPLGMRSPFLGQPSQLMPVTAASVYELQVRGLIAARAAAGAPLPQPVRDALLGLRQHPTVGGMAVVGFNPSTNTVGALNTQLANVPGIEPSLSSTVELGYKGVLGDRFLLAADVWRSEEKDFTSPLVVRTPLLLLNPQTLGPFVAQTLIQGGVPQADAAAIANGLVQIPGAVASSTDVAALGSDLLATYVNFGEVDLWGVDISATALLSDEWSLGATASFVSEHNFCLVDVASGELCPTEQLVALNAPKQKGTATLSYRGTNNGFSAEARVRYTGEFPANSADYVGIKCIVDDPSFEGNDCVDSAALFDLTLGYRVPGARGAEIQLGVTNLFNDPYRSFIGVPAVGRLALLRLKYAFR
jgi:iron complex outermembrane receptor protein